MRSRAFRQRHRTALALLAQILVMMTVVVATVYAVYSVQRPLADGKIYQWYLYGEDGHKGVDFPASEGTDVYAVADGVVMDLKESVHNGTGVYFGNYVLIRHNDRHYVRHNDGQLIGQMGHVYSIYAHLSKNSVPDHIHIGDTVTAGQKIAEVDNTGNSTGNHLHLQVMLDPSADHDDGTDYDWTETTSRNPGAWLEPFNDGTTQTATAVGKVTDENGDPVPNLRIYGMEKPDGAIWNPSEYPYEWSDTYNDDRENPDDILVENFATTDVAPDTYDLVAKQWDEAQQEWVVYKQLGSHTFTAGQTTYVGLYPVYLPDIKENYSGWNSSIMVRNNSDSNTAQVNTTFFRYDGERVYKQKTDYIAPRGTVVVDFPGTCYYCRGSAIVSASEDVSVVVDNHNSSTGRTYSYNGVAATDPLNPGWGEVGTILYAPSIYNNSWGYNSTLKVMNTSTSQAVVQIQFKGRTGYNDVTPSPYYISVNGSREIPASSVLGSTPWLGSLIIESTNGQPLAAVVHTAGSQFDRAYNTVSAGSSPIYLPMAYKNKWSMTSGLIVQNVGSQTATATLYFYDRDGTYHSGYTYTMSNIGPGRAQGLWLGDVSSPPGGWTGWIKVVSQRPLAVEAFTKRHETHCAYIGAFQPGNAAVLPSAAKNAGGRTTGYIVLNTSSSQVQVTPTYYNTSGDVSYAPSPYALEPREVRGQYQAYDPLGDGWQGSILLQAQANGPLVAVMRKDRGTTTTSCYNGVAR